MFRISKLSASHFIITIILSLIFGTFGFFIGKKSQVLSDNSYPAASQRLQIQVTVDYNSHSSIPEEALAGNSTAILLIMA